MICNIRTKKGQTSTELLIYVGVALIILGYIFLFLYPQANRDIKQMNSYYADLLTSTLSSNINSVWNLGVGSEYIMHFNVQKGVTDISFSNQGNGGEVEVTFSDNGNVQQIVKPVSAKFCENNIKWDVPSTGMIYIKLSNVESTSSSGGCIKVEKPEEK